MDAIKQRQHKAELNMLEKGISSLKLMRGEYQSKREKMKQTIIHSRCVRCNKKLYFMDTVSQKNYVFHKGEYICKVCFYKPRKAKGESCQVKE
jgi:hypothetical protein